jgi:hypothetical protein
MNETSQGTLTALSITLLLALSPNAFSAFSDGA